MDSPSIDKLLCHKSASIIEAIGRIDAAVQGTVFVVDDDNRLVGVVTDGDIRRALLAGKTFATPVEEILHSSFVYAHESESTDQLLARTNETIRLVPIVDDDQRVVDFFKYDRRIHLPVATPNLKGNEFRYLTDAFLSTWISSAGKYIRRFEEDFAAYCGARFGLATSNGTVALHLAMKAMDIGPGDEVILPNFTFAASINAVLHTGATPVLVDIEPEYWCIDPDRIEEAITPRTKAIMPVHLYGQPCEMDRIVGLAKEADLFVVEDAAEAHGATFAGQTVGSFGDVACFSFFANKVITTGEGGMCVTNSDELRERMSVLRDHGMRPGKKYWHDVIGYNYRMTNLQAAIGVAQLERIEEILDFRRSIENDYRRELAFLDHLAFQKDAPDRERITWLVCATFDDGRRDERMDALREAGIDCRPFFYPLSEMPLYQKYARTSAVSESVAHSGVIFPTSNRVKPEQFEVIKKILKAN